MKSISPSRLKKAKTGFKTNLPRRVRMQHTAAMIPTVLPISSSELEVVVVVVEVVEVMVVAAVVEVVMCVCAVGGKDGIRSDQIRSEQISSG